MRARALTDAEEITLRARDVVIGAVLGIATAAAVIAYAVQTPASPHRGPLIGLCLAWAIANSGLFLVRRRRLAASRLREPFFLVWSLMVIASITAAVMIEGRSGTPIMGAFILPLVFAAISYPVLLTAIIGSVTLIFAAAAGTLIGQPFAHTMLQVLTLAFAAVMGVWQAYGRERRAEQLATEHRRAQQYLDVAGTMIVVLDRDARIEQVNRRTCEVLGYRDSELMGRSWFDVAVPEDGREAALAVFARTIDGSSLEAHEREHPVVTRSGETRWISWSARVVATTTGAEMVIAGEDITARRVAQEHVRHMAYHDGLTGLANRTKLEEHVALALARALELDRSAAVLYIDLDHFKVVNDTLGHAAGDELLRQVATRLAGCCRASDLLARHGGDEFMLLLADIDGDAAATARRVANDVLATLQMPFTLEGHEFAIAASVGIATFPADGSDLAQLLRRADGALYDAKRGGRGTIRFAAGEPTLT